MRYQEIRFSANLHLFEGFIPLHVMHLPQHRLYLLCQPNTTNVLHFWQISFPYRHSVTFVVNVPFEGHEADRYDFIQWRPSFPDSEEIVEKELYEERYAFPEEVAQHQQSAGIAGLGFHKNGNYP